MTIGKYCQVCGALKKPAEIIGEVHGVVLSADCLVERVFVASPDAVRELPSLVRFCRVCGVEQPKPLPDHCVKCGAALTADAAAQDLAQAGTPAELGRRLAAFVLDCFFIGPIFGACMFLLSGIDFYFPQLGLAKLLHSELWIAVAIIVFILYHTVFTALLGRTPGKLVCGLRVVLKDGTLKVGWFRSFMRSCLYFLTLYVMPLGAILVLLYEPPGERRRILREDSFFHNQLSDTVVIQPR